MRRLIRTAIIVPTVLLAMQSFANSSTIDLNQKLSSVLSNVSTEKVLAVTPAQSMRDEAIRRAALVYGAQNGRYYRWKQVESLLFKRASLLSRVFNFSAMYLDDGLIQPPVLDISSNVTHISSSGQMRKFINNVYRVLLPASFKSTPVTWQTFLLPVSLSTPAKPREALLAKNDHETALWQQAVKEGWEKGVEEANSEYETRLRSLKSAYDGMVLYSMFAMRGMISPPNVVRSGKDVDRSVDGKKMAVGIKEQVIRRNSYFIDKPNHWKPVYYSHKFSLVGE